jgi:zinc/manganese transport system ATP-binding protein
MHDLPLVRDHFTHALMLARELIGWGDTKTVMCDENFARAMALSTSWHEHADECYVEPVALPATKGHKHDH